jgi:methylmalonyl-CoA mutase
MRYESGYDAARNAANGSFFFEKLTAEMAEKAWKMFVELEGKGGIWKFFDSPAV